MKTRKFLLAVLAILLPFIANADAIEVDGIYYNINASDKTAEVTCGPFGFDGEWLESGYYMSWISRGYYTGEIVIPDYIIYDGTKYCVTAIGGEDVLMPNKKQVMIDEEPWWEWRDDPKPVFTGAFEHSSGLTSVTIPNTVITIGKRAFSDCRTLTYINIPNSVNSIGNSAFANCSGLTSITIPNSVTSIGQEAFSGCRNMNTMIIGSGVTSIDATVFAKCSGLASITIPNSVNAIGNGAFADCSALTSLNISSTTIGTWFKGITSIKEVVFGEGVISVVDEAFNGCKSISFIEFPESITEIGQRAFANIDKLSDVFCFAKEVPSTNRTAFENSYVDYATLHVPESSIESYKSIGPWSGFKSIVAGVPTYTLTYVVDGVTYKSIRHEEGETIIPEKPLTKEGYTFLGWSEIPQIMPDHDVTITGTFIRQSLGKCAAPTVSIVNGEIVFACEMDDVQYHYDIRSLDDKSGEGNNIRLTNTYRVSVYASKDGYDNSDVTTKDIQLLLYDANGDGVLNAADIVTIANMIMSSK